MVTVTCADGRAVKWTDGALGGDPNLIALVLRAEHDWLEVEITPVGPIDRVRVGNVRSVIAFLGDWYGPVTVTGDTGDCPYPDDASPDEGRVF